MTSKVVESRPYLLWSFASLADTLKTPGLATDSVKVLALFVSIEIVLRYEALGSFAVRNCTSEWFVVQSCMFTTLTFNKWSDVKNLGKNTYTRSELQFSTLSHC